MSAAQHRAQIQLLVRLLPLVSADSDFTLKGGTAIALPQAADLPAVHVLPAARRDALTSCLAGGLRL